MNILIANWSWYPSGGDWTYVDNISRFYKELHHNIIPFSMKDERNYSSSFSKYFINNINYKNLNTKKNLINLFNVLTKTFYSVEVKKNLVKLLNENEINVAHFNNVHHYLSPIILINELKKRNIPIIWTLHDYTILCPENSYINNGEICELCAKGKYYNCAINRCKKKSFLASSAAALENYIISFSNVLQNVDYFLCPSKFIYNKFIEYGFPSKKFIVTNLIYLNKNEFRKNDNCFEFSNKDYVLYLGRIEKIKGIQTMLQAFKGIKDIDLLIAGGGSLENELKKSTVNPNVKFLGFRKKEEILCLIKNSLFTIVPSEWYENFPYSIIESMSLGKPVLGARIGGIPELVIDGYTGYMFTPKNVNDLENKIKLMLNDKNKLGEMGINAKNHMNNLTSFKSHYTKMKFIFEKIGLDL